MRISPFVTCALAALQAADAFSIPNSQSNSVSKRDADYMIDNSNLYTSSHQDLWKRKGGGGGGSGGGGGGGGHGGGGKGGSSSGGGSSGGGSSSSSSSTGRTNPSSNSGGSTSRGSGSPRYYGGGAYYGGGSSVPYTAGARSLKGLIPVFLGIGALAFFPGLWLFGAYMYTYSNQYTFMNMTLANATNPNGVSQTIPVHCLCQIFQVCGCDDNTDTQFLNDIIGNGSYDALNKTLITVANVNDTTAIYINGTLPNGTTAPGGVGEGSRMVSVHHSGYWVMGAIVLYTVFS